MTGASSIVLSLGLFIVAMLTLLVSAGYAPPVLEIEHCVQGSGVTRVRSLWQPLSSHWPLETPMTRELNNWHLMLRGKTMTDEGNLKPYSLAQQRFSHACNELSNADRPINRRVLNAIVALSPLRVEDMPRNCQLFYEKVQQLIGPGLWDSDAMSGALASAVDSLPLHRANIVTEWIVMAQRSLDKHCSIESGVQAEPVPNKAPENEESS